MRELVATLSNIGERLSGFGDDALTESVIYRACEANGWFSPADIRRAVRTIARDMLCRERLEEWLSHYPVPVVQARQVLVVMAGNIPLVGFFDMLCVVASGHRCLVKPSSKDRVLMEYVVGLFNEIAPDIGVAFYSGAERVDAVIATGSDNANRYFRAQYSSIPALLRANRHSVAVLSGKESEEQLLELADDIWAYSGLGCRNVSLLFVPKGYDLRRLQMPVMNPKYRNNYLQQMALLTMSGQKFIDFYSGVAIERRAFPDSLSCICYSHYKTLDEVSAWLSEHDSEVQCVVSESIDHPRRTQFGFAQSPALTDYPDGRDVMEFLTMKNA